MSVAQVIYVLTSVHVYLILYLTILFVYICRSLSEEDIEKVVGGGCPNLLGRAVNSAKRLRAHVRLDEGDVCNLTQLQHFFMCTHLFMHQIC